MKDFEIGTAVSMELRDHQAASGQVAEPVDLTGKTTTIHSLDDGSLVIETRDLRLPTTWDLFRLIGRHLRVIWGLLVECAFVSRRELR